MRHIGVLSRGIARLLGVLVEMRKTGVRGFLLDLLVLALVIAPATAWGQQPDQSSTAGRLAERLVARTDQPPWEASTAVSTPDARRLTYVARVGDRHAVVVDGTAGKPYDEILSKPVLLPYRLPVIGARVVKPSLLFSPDGNRLTYAARAGNKWMIVVDGAEGKPYDQVALPAFSPDGQRLAYVARIQGRWVMVVDGREERAYENVFEPVFSPDGKRLAYSVVVDGKWRAYLGYATIAGRAGVVVDGKELEGHEYADSPHFSPDGTRLAYVVLVGRKWSVVVDDRPEQPYDAVLALAASPADSVSNGSLRFSSDSKRLAYVARSGSKRFVVIDGHEGQGYESIADYLTFSPDGQRLAYVAGARGKWFVVEGAREGRAYDEIVPYSLTFLSDGRLMYVTRMQGRWAVVIDTTEQKPYDGINQLTISPDGSRVFYAGGVSKRRVFVPGTLVSSFRDVIDKWAGVVDGKEGKIYDSVNYVTFSPDNRRVAYAARLQDRTLVVVDGVESGPYDAAYAIHFDASNRLRYLARRGNEIYVLEETKD